MGWFVDDGSCDGEKKLIDFSEVIEKRIETFRDIGHELKLNLFDVSKSFFSINEFRFCDNLQS